MDLQWLRQLEGSAPFDGLPEGNLGRGKGMSCRTRAGIHWTLTDSVRTSQPQPFSFVEVVHAGGLPKKGIIIESRARPTASARLP